MMSSSQQSHRGFVEHVNSPVVTGELEGVRTHTAADAMTESVDVSIDVPTMPTSAIGAASGSETQQRLFPLSSLPVS